MSFSPALAHRQRKLAAIAAADTGADADLLPEIDDSNPAAAEYRQLLASLHADVRTLSEIQSHADRLPKKKAMLATYEAWIMGALEAGKQGTAVQDDVLATGFIWAVDLADWEAALILARHMIEHGVALPTYGNFKRTPAIFLVDRAAEMAKADPASVPLDVLQEVSALTAGHDMRDDSRAKLLRAIGLAQFDAAEKFDPAADNAVAGGKAALVEAALVSLRAAVKLDPQVGVKKQIEQAERLQKKLAAEASGN